MCVREGGREGGREGKMSLEIKEANIKKKNY